MIRRLLVDYGEVLSTPLAEDAIADLAALAGQPRATFIDRYWRLRPAYDLGQPPTEYWSAVLDRDLGGSPRFVDRLTRVDVRGWLGRNPLTLRALRVLKSVDYRGWICVDLDTSRLGPLADFKRCGDYIVNKLEPIYL